MQKEIIDQLTKLFEEYNNELFKDKLRTQGLLLDLLKNRYKKEIKALICIIQYGLCEEISQKQKIDNIFISTNVNRINDQEGIDKGLLSEAIRTWAIVMNVDVPQDNIVISGNDSTDSNVVALSNNQNAGLDDYNKGVALIKLKKYEEAITYFNEAIKLDPNNGLYWGNKGFALYLLKKYVEAITCYDEAIKLDPNNGLYWNNKGFALYLLKKYVEAITCYDEAIKLDPSKNLYKINKKMALWLRWSRLTTYLGIFFIIFFFIGILFFIPFFFRPAKAILFDFGIGFMIQVLLRQGRKFRDK